MGELTPFGVIVDAIVDNLVAQQKDKCDYIGEDGLLYCGKCRTPKQGVVNWYNDGKKTVPTPCKCKKEKYQAEEKLKKIEELRDNSGIEPKFRKSTFDSVEVNANNQRAVKICKKYVDKFDELASENQGLLFYGNVGTGKSMLAHCIANELINKLHSAASISLAKVLKSGVVSQEEEISIMRKVRDVELLIIDDLGAERGTEFAQQFVYSVIDTRCNYKKPMIVTANLTLVDMQNCSDMKYKRIYDRVLEYCYPIELTGVSWRMRNAAERYDRMTDMLGGND